MLQTLYFTASTKQSAETIARTLVDERLIACANIVEGVTSVFEWNGRACSEPEVVVFAKTTQAQASRAVHRIAELHDYDCPCVTVWDITTAADAYAQWVRDQVRRP